MAKFNHSNNSNKNKSNQNRGAQQDNSAEYRVNDQIKVPEVRLIGDNLDELSEKVGEKIESAIYPTRKLRAWAELLDIDLVEITPNANPPVVRIIDYNKFLYQKRKKEKEIKANTAKTVLKEIRFSPHTDDHDFTFKTKHAIEFLQEGSKVKAYVTFKGRAIVFQEPGELLLLKFIKELEDYGAPETLPKLEGRRMMVVLTPKKGVKK